VCFSSVTADSCVPSSGVPSTSSAVSSAAAVSSTAVSEESARLPSDADADAADAAVDSLALSLAASSTASHLPLYASSSLPTTSTPTPSPLPISLDSLMATLGSMESIAMIAAQLVPLLANLDTCLLMQMLQVANPAVATALSAYCMQSAVASDPRQVPATSSQTDVAALPFPLPNTAYGSCGSGQLQNQASVSVSSQSWPVAVAQPSDVVPCDGIASSESVRSTVDSSSPAIDGTVVQTDTTSSDTLLKQRYELPDACPSPLDVHRPSSTDVHRPSSTASTSSSMYSTDRQPGKHDNIVPLGAVLYTCHLCAFRSAHRTHFAEHLSSEFCTTNISATARTATDGELTRRKRCSYCSFSTYLTEEYDDHIRIHASSDLYHCAYCDYVGVSHGALKLHFTRSHPRKTFVFRESVFEQKSKVDSRSSNRSGVPQPQSVNLDPVVEMYDEVTVDHGAIKKLKNRYGIAKINLSGL